MQKSKAASQSDDEEEMEGDGEGDSFVRKGSDPMSRRPAFSKKLVKSGKNERAGSGKDGGERKRGMRFRTELKRPEEILKQRKLKEKKMQKNMPKGMRKKRGREGAGGGGGFKGKGGGGGGGRGGKRK